MPFCLQTKNSALKAETARKRFIKLLYKSNVMQAKTQKGLLSTIANHNLDRIFLITFNIRRHEYLNLYFVPTRKSCTAFFINKIALKNNMKTCANKSK